ncbi:hypothetical protein HPB48_023142 [Haemaphysalis longicornis]|uniref:Uncharacterized protein n=1 Tax=Haemaphysalis longicornis TaxID=44386 RepID=A0A9J6GYS2_HAELO|nr:hypothetical protein HPB48_023142 [Haemaphysalis longicornis]
MEVLDVEGEPITPEEITTEAGWMTSHRQRGAKSLNELSLTRKQNNNNDGAGSGVVQANVDGRSRGRKKRHVRLFQDANKDKQTNKQTKISQALLKDGILRAAALKAEETTEDIFCTNNFENIIVTSASSIKRPAKYNRITELSIGGETQEITAYVTPPEDCSKGVPAEDSADDITHSLVYRSNPKILQARRMGKTNSAIIVFEGDEVPYFAYYRGAEYHCYLHKKRHEICKTCRRFWHRTDVCPTPEIKVCKGCATNNPPENHRCDPKCALCGREHPTADKKCRQRYQVPHLLKKRQWERKIAQQRQTDGNSRQNQGQRNVQENSTGILRLERDRSGSFPRLPLLEEVSNKTKKEEKRRTTTTASGAPLSSGQRTSRSTSRLRDESRSRPRSKSQARNGTNVASHLDDRRDEDHHQNKVSSASAVSHSSTQQHKQKIPSAENES